MSASGAPVVFKGATLCARNSAIACACVLSPVTASRFTSSATMTRKLSSPTLQSSGSLPCLWCAPIPLTLHVDFTSSQTAICGKRET